MFRRFLRSLAWRAMPWAGLTLNLSTGISFPIRTRQEARLVQEILLERAYQPLLEALDPPRTLVDLGCNAGFFTLFVEHERRRRAPASPPARGLLVDANPDCLRRARSTLRLNRLADRFDLVDGLIGPPGEPIEFHISKADGHSSAFHRYCTRRTVRRTSLDLEAEITRRFPDGVDLMKVDIEGGEKFLLEHWAHTLRRSRAILLEWHRFALEGDELERRMRELGFELRLKVQESAHQANVLYAARPV
ncbi:MAG: FkbM family methyltransferase [Verrucomicrobiae bacterium]|nr:FkbM family methyltransferase [Verrucomicrobiae bacterium]